MKAQRLIAVCLLLLVCLVCRSVMAQTLLTAPYVLGCANPAPAAPGSPTVFINSCKTPVFVPLSTSSVVASVSKTAPVWGHSFNSYAATVQIVACPAGASLSADAGKCTKPGTTTDASSLLPQSSVAAFSIAPTPAPVTPIPMAQDYTFSWSPPLSNNDGTKITDLTAYLLSTAPTSLGPFLQWTMVSSSITTYTYKALPTQTPVCFAIAGFSASLGSGVPLVFCRPPVTASPTAPTAK